VREIVRLVVVLSAICGFSAGALTFARQHLADRIEKQNDFYVRGPALERLFKQPAADLLDNKISFTMDGLTYPVFFTREGDIITGLAVEAPGAGGYAGDIVIMVAIDLTTQRMVGMEIIQHSETPGVGAQVEKAGFRRQWAGLPAAERVGLTSQGGRLDAISGATYSSRAVINGTNRIVDLVSRNRDELLATIKDKES
jgi:electron transport complex protein RnfG